MKLARPYCSRDPLTGRAHPTETMRVEVKREGDFYEYVCPACLRRERMLQGPFLEDIVAEDAFYGEGERLLAASTKGRRLRIVEFRDTDHPLVKDMVVELIPA